MDIACFLNLVKKWEVEYIENFDISKHSYIGIGGVARLAVFPKKCSDLVNTVSCLFLNGLKFKVVGKLTNILFKDSIFDGVIVNTSKMRSYSVAESYVDAECGVGLSRLIYDAASFSLGGLESLYGIPASLGGAVYSNAGAYGNSISDFLCFARVFDLQTQKIRTLSASELELSYRHSLFMTRPMILLYARVNFVKGSQEEIKEKLKQTLSKRRASQPYSEKSLGSVFKREGDIPISRLIDEAGLKGRRIGDALVSPKHAGFIVNCGSASALDVIRLIELIKIELLSRYGIWPSEEIEII